VLVLDALLTGRQRGGSQSCKVCPRLGGSQLVVKRSLVRIEVTGLLQVDQLFAEGPVCMVFKLNLLLQARDVKGCTFQLVIEERVAVNVESDIWSCERVGRLR